MFGPQWGVTRTASASTDRTAAGTQSGTPPVEVGEGHPGPIGAGCEILGMITQRQDPQPEGAGRQYGRSSGPIDIGSRTRPRDPDAGEMVERVLQSLLAEVERVVIGKADAVDPQVGERVGRGCWSPKEEGLAGCGPPGSPLGDATLQVQDEQVAVCPGDRRDRQRGRPPERGRSQTVRHATSEHGVSGQRELDGHTRILPRRLAIRHLDISSFECFFGAKGAESNAPVPAGLLRPAGRAIRHSVSRRPAVIAAQRSVA